MPGMMGGMPQPGFGFPGQGMPGQQFALPAALLQQFPDLQGLNWDTLPQGAPDEMDDVSGRSGYDGSSGGELYDDEDDYNQNSRQAMGWASDQGF